MEVPATPGPQGPDRGTAISLEDFVPQHDVDHLGATLDLGFVRRWTREPRA